LSTKKVVIAWKGLEKSKSSTGPKETTATKPTNDVRFPGKVF